jgi:hypothetical protein
MSQIILGLQAAIASGSEMTFDGQPMEAGIHLKWTFSAELGFPPGGFRLCRKIEEPVVPPQGCKEFANPLINSTGLPPILVTPTIPVEVITPTNKPIGTTDQKKIIDATTKSGPAEINLPQKIKPRQPDLTSREIRPKWGDKDQQGWQCLDFPFTLPITHSNWPARYRGAPDPLSALAGTIKDADIAESFRRLGVLALVAGASHQEQTSRIVELRDELIRLVQGFPGTLLYNVPLVQSSVPNAPSIDINLMQQLLLLALNPHFATVLGLYFVDRDVNPGVRYIYCITGYWGSTPCSSVSIYPGLASAKNLAIGKASYKNVTLNVDIGSTSMFRWVHSNVGKEADPDAPVSIVTAFNSAKAGIASLLQPTAMLAVGKMPKVFDPPLSPPSLPEYTLSISLKKAASKVEVQVSGSGMVHARSKGFEIANAPFNKLNGLQNVILTTPNSDAALIDEILIIGLQGTMAFVVAKVTSYLLIPEVIGTRCAMVRGSYLLRPIAPPLVPVIASFIHREAEIDTTNLKLVPHSRIHVEWPALLKPSPIGDPIKDPYSLPVPILPVGFVVERQDSDVNGSLIRIPRVIMASSSPTPIPNDGTTYPIPTPRLYRLADSRLEDPVGGWQYRIAGFDIFGALGIWSQWTQPLKVQKLAAPPTGLAIQDFDNQETALPYPGGPDLARLAWVGGTLTARVNWAGSAFMMYPDTKSARALTKAIDTLGVETGLLAFQDLPLPTPTISRHQITSVTPTPDTDPASNGAVKIKIGTLETLPVLDATMPSAVLMISLLNEADPKYSENSERYSVRPFSAGGQVFVEISVSPTSLIATARNAANTASAFINKFAYIVQGFSNSIIMDVPLSIPVGEKTARGQLTVETSISDSFDINEKIIDPNGFELPREKAKPISGLFIGPLRLLPPVPPTPPQDNFHQYYDPADFEGNAGRTLPFDTFQSNGVSGFVLFRAPVGGLAISDVRRRIKLTNIADANPTIAGRNSLDAWTLAIGRWLDALNIKRLEADSSAIPLTSVDALKNEDAQKAFIEHFYWGLHKDELRSLSDLQSPLTLDNTEAFARINPTPITEFGKPIRDYVDGKGLGSYFYKLASVNSAGSISAMSGAIGPYYTRVISQPRPPVIYRVLPQLGAMKVEWTLDLSPDTVGYLLYRSGNPETIKDLRYFGPDPSNPDMMGVARIECNLTRAKKLSFSIGALDPRIVGLIPDPRLIARDYNGSEMGEVTLPEDFVPESIEAVYRLGDYNPARDPLDQPQAFNYARSSDGNLTCEIFGKSPSQSRIGGLRIGLGGRGVPVVVVATDGLGIKTFGSMASRRIHFIDGLGPANIPRDRNSVTTYSPPVEGTNYYTMVAVDIYCNRSQPSKQTNCKQLIL